MIITNEMVNFFYERTNIHISLVQKYIDKIVENNIFSNKGNEKLYVLGNKHDDSKFDDPELFPYVIISWDYRCKDKGIDFSISDSIKNKMNAATNHHVKNNKHHPDYWDPDKENINVINKEDRDKPLEKIIDATKMPKIYLTEMVADWCAMSEEKNTDPFDWANNNINVRWKFTKDQEDFIYKLLHLCWMK